MSAFRGGSTTFAGLGLRLAGALGGVTGRRDFGRLDDECGDFRGEAPFGVWVRSIAVSRCLMSFRSPWHRARVALEAWTEDTRAATLRTWVALFAVVLAILASYGLRNWPL